jgi:hypothetical protein
MLYDNVQILYTDTEREDNGKGNLKTAWRYEDFSKVFKASGVVVEQKPGSPTTLAFYSRWSQKEIQKTN